MRIFCHQMKLLCSVNVNHLVLQYFAPLRYRLNFYFAVVKSEIVLTFLDKFF